MYVDPYMSEVASFEPFCCLNYFDFSPELHKCGSEGFSAGLIDDDDVYKWEVVIYGPPDTLQ